MYQDKNKGTVRLGSEHIQVQQHQHQFTLHSMNFLPSINGVPGTVQVTPSNKIKRQLQEIAIQKMLLTELLYIKMFYIIPSPDSVFNQ